MSSSDSCTCACAHACMCVYVIVYACMCAHAHARMHTHAHTHMHTPRESSRRGETRVHCHTAHARGKPRPAFACGQRRCGGPGGGREWGGGGCWRVLVDVGRSIENWFAGRLCLCMCVFVCVCACVCMCVLCIRHSPISPRKHPPTTHAHTHTHTHTHTATQTHTHTHTHTHTATQTHTHTHTAGGLSVGISAHGGHNTTQTRHTSPRRKACQRPARSPPPCPPR